MTILKTAASAAFLAIAATPGLSQEIPRLSMVDFVIDWQKYEGQFVVITDGMIAGATMDFVQLYTEGARVHLRPPWVQREDMRYVLKKCAGLIGGEGCQILVGGFVEKADFGGGPQLTKVDFAVPQ
jgi:hypothetical protein